MGQVVWKWPGIADLKVVTEDPQRPNTAGPHGEGALPKSDAKINGGELRQKSILSLHPGDCEEWMSAWSVEDDQLYTARWQGEIGAGDRVEAVGRV